MNNDKQTKQKKEKLPLNFSLGTNINLIPPLTAEEKKVEVTKTTINVNAAFALLFLIILSIAIVGFNLVSKLSLNAEKERLFTLEQNIRSRIDVLTSNDEILRRIDLYRDIEETTFSTKEVLDYWDAVAENLADINEIVLNNGMVFEVNGTADSLSDVSRLWYLLGNDGKVESVDLKSVAKDENTIRFNFEGKLNFSAFKDAGS